MNSRLGKLLIALCVPVICWLAGGYVLKLGFIPILEYEKQWSIAIFKGTGPFALTGNRVKNPVLTAEDVTDVTASFVADPFMIRKGQAWYMFFEVYNTCAHKGSIGFATSADGHTWKYGKIALDEPFHLSYPYVFEWENEYYMVPESGDIGSIRLYRAVEFPEKWEYIRDLVTGRDFVDNSFARHGGKWWLFTQTGPFRSGMLRLYYADDLEGPWKEHIRSPVVVDEPHRARGGGRIVSYKGKLFRLAQDDSPHYGMKVRAIEIEKLTPESYLEKDAGNDPVVQAGHEWWNGEGMHTVDPHRIEDNLWIACVDGYRMRWRLHFQH